MEDERTAAGPKLDHLRVLVVDDCRALRQLFARLLRQAGAAVVEADTGRKALELALRERFDIVLSDLGLPDMAGQRLIKLLLASTPHMYVVVISGGELTELDEARVAGAHAVFRKPVEWDDVLSTLREVGGTAGRIRSDQRSGPLPFERLSDKRGRQRWPPR